MTNRLKAMAQEHRDKLAFVLVNRADHAKELEELGGSVKDQKQARTERPHHADQAGMLGACG